MRTPGQRRRADASYHEVLRAFTDAWRTPGAAIVPGPGLETLRCFLAAIEAHWRDVTGPRLQRLAGRVGAFDPARSRGDELELFSAHHEDDYSNWLRWLVRETGEQASALQGALLRALGEPAGRAATFRVDREVAVERGHEDRAGFLDLVLVDEARRDVIVIENKTRWPGAEELRKHRGYVESVERKYGAGWRRRFFLLLPDPGGEAGVLDTCGFVPVSWHELTRALRRLLQERVLEAREAAMVEVFVGAVEQYVLHYPVALWRQYLRTAQPGGAAALAPVGAHALSASGYLEYLEDAHGQREGGT